MYDRLIAIERGLAMKYIYKATVNINEEQTEFYNILENDCFAVSGIFQENGKFRRLPEEVAKTVSAGVYDLHASTTGGRVRFKTDSSFIAFRVEMDMIRFDSNAPVTANSGFDIYERKNGEQYFLSSVMPPFDFDDGYEAIVKIANPEMKEYVINFPMWSEVKNLYIGLEKGAKLEKPDDYKYSKPVVFYGSSITMGKCFSRPGCSYENVLSRRLDMEYINLGFGGAAKGEKEIVEYISNLDMSVFVLDYDWNAPNVEHLKATHEPFYKAVREKHKDIPIIMMSRPKYYLTDVEKERRAVVEETYNNAVKNGDNNVYYIPGNTLMDEKVKDNGTVDGVHPNDAGFLSMANVIEPFLRKALSGE